jgi:hypothetical protein
MPSPGSYHKPSQLSATSENDAQEGHQEGQDHPPIRILLTEKPNRKQAGLKGKAMKSNKNIFRPFHKTNHLQNYATFKK